MSGKSTKVDWVYAGDKLPNEEGAYLVCFSDGFVDVGTWYKEDKSFFDNGVHEEPKPTWHDPWQCNAPMDGVMYWAEYPDGPNKKTEDR